MSPTEEKSVSFRKDEKLIDQTTRPSDATSRRTCPTWNPKRTGQAREQPHLQFLQVPAAYPCFRLTPDSHAFVFRLLRSTNNAGKHNPHVLYLLFHTPFSSRSFFSSITNIIPLATCLVVVEVGPTRIQMPMRRGVCGRTSRTRRRTLTKWL